jgi:hypothetical protein
MEKKLSKQTPQLPPSALRHAPKRENFHSEEEYEEALAFFKHRTKHLLRASPQK